MPLANLLALLGVLASGAFSGPRVDIALELHTGPVETGSPTEAVISAVPGPTGPGGTIDSRPPIRVRTQAPASLMLYLYPEADHLLKVENGLWAPPVVLRSADPPKELTVTASGAGVLRMELVNRTGHPLGAWPETVQARFQLFESPLAIRPDRSFEADCPVSMEQDEGKDNRVLVCELPEGLLNVRLEAEGFIPHYLWELRMKPMGSLELPPYALEKGGSLIGTAVREGGATAVGAEVVLGPTLSDNAARATLANRSSVLESRTTTDERGFFQIRGIPRGSFDLQVRLAGYGLGVAPELEMFEPIEHRLDERVTIPYFPEAVVSVSPATDPADAPWSLFLFDPDGINRTARTDPLGEGRFELLPSGQYVLVVQDSDGQRWVAEVVRFGPREPRVEIRIEQVPVIGTVTLDGEPLVADLYFGGRHGSESVEVSSEADGEFFGILPREGTWDVEIRAEEPTVRAIRRSLLVELDPGLGAAELAIDLPATSIEGRVTDEGGHPAAGAQVILQPGSRSGFRATGITQVETGSDGSFALAGQRPGTYHLKALGQDGTSTATEVIEVIDDRSTPPVELILKKSREIEGRVVSLSGRGVPGAIVWPAREVGSPPPLDQLVRQVRTGPNGEFRLALGPDNPYGAVAILAPGFLLKVESLPRESEDLSMEIVLEPATSGGSLILVDAQGSEPSPGGTVTINGRWMLPLFLLAKRSGRDAVQSSDQPLVVPHLPPGRYVVCIHPEIAEPSCTGGFLSAGATLELHTKEKSP